METTKKDWTAEALPRGKNYFIVNTEFADKMGISEGPSRSKVIKDKFKDNVCIIIANITKLEDLYKKLGNPSNFYAREIVESNVRDNVIKKITLGVIKTKGLFQSIENKTGATTLKNCACVIGSISKMQGLTPIELFNTISE